MTLGGAPRASTVRPGQVLCALVVIVALAACAPESRAVASPTQAVSGGHGTAIGPSASPSLDVVTVKTATYGSLIVETAPGASCKASTQLPSGGTVLAADFLTARTVDANGRATWSYAIPVAGAGEGSGRYEVTCTLADQTVRASADFAVP